MPTEQSLAKAVLVLNDSLQEHINRIVELEKQVKKLKSEQRLG
jgi:hypothetical protein